MCFIKKEWIIINSTKMAIYGVKDWYKWDDDTKKPIERLGTSYIVIKHKQKGPVLVTIKVPGAPVISDDEVRRAYKNQTVIWADFEDYEEDISLFKGQTFYKGTATVVTLVSDDSTMIDID